MLFMLMMSQDTTRLFTDSHKVQMTHKLYLPMRPNETHHLAKLQVSCLKDMKPGCLIIFFYQTLRKLK